MSVPEPLLTTQEFAAIATAGFHPLGPISCRTVIQLSYLDREERCSSRSRGSQQTDLAAAVGGSFYAMLRQRYQARQVTLTRMVAACRERGGDGIVGLKLSISPYPSGRTAFTMRGTAIRARTGPRPAGPFTTHIPGQALASLLRAGWVPVSVVFGISLGSRHDDFCLLPHPDGSADTRRELRSYSELIRDTRRDARTRLGHVVTDLGADGVLVDNVTVRISERDCPKLPGEQDRIAEAVIFGTAIVSSGRSPEAGDMAPVRILRLNPAPPARPDLIPQLR